MYDLLVIRITSQSSLTCTPLNSFNYCYLPDIGVMVRVFANGPGDLDSIPDRVIPKPQKWYLLLSCLTLSIIRYRPRVKWSNSEKGVAPSSTPIEKGAFGSLLIIVDYCYLTLVVLINIIYWFHAV